MKKTVPLCFLRKLLLPFLALAPLAAQDPGLNLDLKLRWGYGLVTQDHLRPAAMGFGLCGAYDTPYGKVDLELGYYYKTGDQYLQPITEQAPAPLNPVNQAMSGDSRRNQLDGLALRLSFQRPITDDGSWQVGVMVGGTRFKHEYVGDVEGQNWTSPTDGSVDTSTWRDTYNGTPVQGGPKISPFGGFVYALSGHSSLEINLLLVNYTALSYVHHPGSGTYAESTVPGSDSSVGRIAENNAFPADTLDKTNRLSPHFELAYVLHF